MSKAEPTPPIIPNKLYFKIGEVSQITGMEPYVIRYWESEFKTIKPTRTQSNQRVYRRKDVENILEIKRLLYEEKLTIAGARRKLHDRKTDDKKQLDLDFSAKKERLDQLAILKEIKEELIALRKILG
jgi:DNA-binding transcriptional MerR regulator